MRGGGEGSLFLEYAVFQDDILVVPLPISAISDLQQPDHANTLGEDGMFVLLWIGGFKNNASTSQLAIKL